MERRNRNMWIAGAMLAATIYLVAGCNETGTDAQASNSGNGNGNGSRRTSASTSSHAMVSGTRIDVSLSSNISSKTAHVGDAWHGTVTQNVQGRDGAMVPAGSQVDGVVTGVAEAVRGSRAMLELGVRTIHVNGRSEPISASAEPVIAGSPRARNLGAIGAGAVAGALIGKAVGDGKNGAVGAVIGGGAAAGVVAGSKGYQVELHDGTVMTFSVNQTVAMR